MTIGIDESKIIAGCSLNSAIAGRVRIFLAVGFKKGLDDKITAYRTAFLIAMTSFFLVGWTGSGTLLMFSCYF